MERPPHWLLRLLFLFVILEEDLLLPLFYSDEVMNMADRKIPKFESEAEEAKWWFDHRAEVGADLVAASRRGVVGEGSLARSERKLREANAMRQAKVEVSV